MPLVMKKIYQISGNYTQEEKQTLQDMIIAFRIRVSDDDPEKNILNKKTQKYSDDKIVQFFKMALGDINSSAPRTNDTIFSLAQIGQDDLIIEGAIVFSLISEGLLQLNNQMDYSDSGLSIALFNKTGLYQGWAGFFLQQYIGDKKEFKSSVIPRSANSGFFGVSSEFGYRWQ
jgi:hypothetical protein